jgi:hypothetical protein
MSNLKKEFQKRDVERMRNLITGKYGKKTTLGIGYKKKQKHHKEGDVWDEDGRTWTIKEGIKQNITKLDKAKKAILMPIFCPDCSKPMTYWQDKNFYNLYKRCFNCQVDFEGDLRVKGLFEEYQKNIINDDIDHFITDYSQFVEECLNKNGEQGFISEAGDIENWKGKINKELVEKSKAETIKYLKSLKK